MCILLLLCTNKIIGQGSKYTSIGIFKGIEYNSFLTTVGSGILYNNGKKLRAGGEIHAYKFWDKYYSSLGIGYSPVLQLFLLKRAKYKLFLDTKGGIIYMFPEYQDTAVNFTFFLAQRTKYFFPQKIN
ncbi:MAG: hypothetical protein Q8T03_01235 [Bacteroidota bacterium]|nr:hypothetical protein [Bacteroidota bacterium]